MAWRSTRSSGRDGPWAAFEIKLGGQKLIGQGAASLLRFARRIDTGASGEPACLGVSVASRYGLVRDDGIAVVQLPALRP